MLKPEGVRTGTKFFRQMHGNMKLPVRMPFMPAGIARELGKTLYSGWIGEGPKVAEFENLLKKYLGNRNVAATNSCTSALHLSLHLAGIESGDEIISTPMTCAAANVTIRHFPAKIVWADISPATGNITPESIEEKISEKTKALCIMHWGGYPCELDEIRKIARRNKIFVIEDAAHALGSEYHAKKIGNHSDFVCFSFQAVKTITTGDGGAIAFKSKKMLKRAKKLRWFGIDREQSKPAWQKQVFEAGYKFHMNDIAATLGIQQFKYLKHILKRQRENAAYYFDTLSNLDGVELLENKKDRKSSSWLFTLLAGNKREFMKKLGQKGIETSPIHARNDKLTVFKEFYSPNLPGTSYFDKKHACIPNGYWIGEKEREYIANAIKKEFK